MRVVRNIQKGTRTDLHRTILFMISECEQDTLGSSGYEIIRGKRKATKLSSTRYKIVFCNPDMVEKLVIISDQHGNIVEQTQLVLPSDDFNLPKDDQMKMLLAIHKTQNKSEEEQLAAAREAFPGTKSLFRERSRRRLVERGYIERGPTGVYITTPVGNRAVGIWRKQDKINQPTTGAYHGNQESSQETTEAKSSHC